MIVNFMLVIYPILLIGVYSGSSPSVVFVGRICFLNWSLWPFAEATLLGKYLVTSWTVSTGHDLKHHFWISLIHVYLAGTNYAVCRYLTKSV